MPASHDGVRTRHLATMEATLETHPIGATPEGQRMVAAVTGGRIEGERLKGRVLPFDEASAIRCAALHVPDDRSDRDSMIAATPRLPA